jgi:DNA-binding transcriptional LysR family regulator
MFASAASQKSLQLKAIFATSGKMIDEISELRLFTRIVAAGNLSEAARRLNSSAPAMSRRLSAFEDRLGVRLVDRSSRRFEVTPEGAALYERALKIVADVDAAEAEVRARAIEPVGRLRIGAPTEIGRRRLASLVAAFSARYPQITCELVLSDAGLELARDGFDFIFRTTRPLEPSVRVLTLLEGKRIVCASPAYFERRGVPRSPEELAVHDCLMLVRGYEVMNHWRFQISGRPIVVDVSGPLSTTSAEVIHGWVLDGIGIAVKALWDIEDELADGRLVECLAEFAQNDMHLYGVTARTKPMPSRVTQFLDFATESLGGSS